MAVFFNLNGKTVALRMEPDQKRVIALMALNTADGRAELIEVPYMTLPEDPAMQEAALRAASTNARCVKLRRRKGCALTVLQLIMLSIPVVAEADIIVRIV